MGNCVSDVVRDSEEVKKMRQIRGTIKRVSKNYIINILKAFQSESTNDRAEIISESTAGLIVNEFARYMGICWFDLYT